MKKLILFLLLTISVCVHANTRLIKIDANSNGTYTVTTWVNKDGSATYVTYSSLEAATKIVPSMSKTISGKSRNSDIALAYFNKDGDLINIDYIVKSSNKDEAPQFTPMTLDKIPAQTVTDITALKDDVLNKTGNPPDTHPIAGDPTIIGHPSGDPNS